MPAEDDDRASAEFSAALKDAVSIEEEQMAPDCTDAFDGLWECFTMGNQMKEFYRPRLVPVFDDVASSPRSLLQRGSARRLQVRDRALLGLPEDPPPVAPPPPPVLLLQCDHPLIFGQDQIQAVGDCGEERGLRCLCAGPVALSWNK